jgi:hypothetical protein
MKKEKSCGTIIIDSNKRVLLVKQKLGWVGFPKGHMEQGETEMETARRETKEETNLDVIVDEKKRYTISYITSTQIDKEVVYFRAKPISYSLLPQEAEIAEIMWVDIDEAKPYLSFDNLKQLWQNVLDDFYKEQA